MDGTMRMADSGGCLAVCPFSRSGYDKVHARFKGNPDAPQFRMPLPMVDVSAEMLSV